MLDKNEIFRLKDDLIDMIRALPEIDPNFDAIDIFLNQNKSLRNEYLNGSNNFLSIYISTPLIVASDRCFPKLIRMLIDAGADPSKPADRRKTPLIYAIENKSARKNDRRESIRILVEASTLEV